MLMTEATPEMVEEWKKIWEENRHKLKPNAKTGAEIVAFLCSEYDLTELYDDNALAIVRDNVMHNDYHKEKLQDGESPLPRAFLVKNSGNGKKLYEKQDEIFKGIDIFVGIDCATGFYHVEGSSLLWDELCAYRGLDEKDIENCFCVAQYIGCSKKQKT